MTDEIEVEDSDTELDEATGKRVARTLRRRIGDLVPSVRMGKNRNGQPQEINLKGNGSLGSALTSILAVKEASGGLGNQSFLDAAEKHLRAYEESVADILDTVPARQGVSRSLKVGDQVVMSKAAPEGLVALFGTDARSVVAIDELNGTVSVEGYAKEVSRRFLVEVSAAAIVAKRRPKGGADE